MSVLTKEQAINLGGNEWVKENLERIYLSAEVVNELIISEGYKAVLISKKMKMAKTFLNVKTGEIFSDVGAIRSSLNSIGYKCGK